MGPVDTGKQQVGLKSPAHIMKNDPICGFAAIGDTSLLTGFWKLFFRLLFPLSGFPL